MPGFFSRSTATARGYETFSSWSNHPTLLADHIKGATCERIGGAVTETSFADRGPNGYPVFKYDVDPRTNAVVIQNRSELKEAFRRLLDFAQSSGERTGLKLKDLVIENIVDTHLPKKISESVGNEQVIGLIEEVRRELMPAWHKCAIL